MGHHPPRPKLKVRVYLGLLLPPSFTSCGSGRQHEARACCMSYNMWCHDMTVVMPCVKWQPSIFAKLLPAFPKEGTNNDYKLSISYEQYFTVYSNILPPEWTVSRSVGQMVRPKVLTLAEA